MLDLTDLLMRFKKFDMVDGRLSVMFEIASQAAKAFGKGLSAREAGRLHLFIMRILALYRERREGYFVKDAADRLFRRYMHREIIPEIQPMLEEEFGKEGTEGDEV